MRADPHYFRYTLTIRTDDNRIVTACSQRAKLATEPVLRQPQAIWVHRAFICRAWEWEAGAVPVSHLYFNGALEMFFESDDIKRITTDIIKGRTAWERSEFFAALTSVRKIYTGNRG